MAKKPTTEETATIVEPKVDKIESTLVKHNVTEVTLREMEERFLPLQINGIQDKAGYKAIAEALTMLRNTRTLTVKICEEGRAEAVKEQKNWLEKQKYVVGRLQGVEVILKERKSVIDDEKERIAQEEETKKLAILSERSNKLMSLGMIYNPNDSNYTMAATDIIVNVLQLKTSSDFEFEGILSLVTSEFNKQEEIRKENARLKEEAELLAKKIAEENRAKEAELKRKEEELAARQKAMEDAEKAAQARLDKIKRDEEEAILKAEQTRLLQVKADQERILNTRISELYALGFSQTNGAFTFAGRTYSIPTLEISNIAEGAWEEFIQGVRSKVAEIKAMLAEQAEEKAAQIKKEAEEKAVEELRASVAKQEEERLRKLSLATDDELFNQWIVALQSHPVPDFKTADYIQYKTTIVLPTLDSLIRHLQTKKPK